MLIWKPSNKKFRHNDVIEKTILKFGLPRNQTNDISFESFDKNCPKMYFLLNINHCVKSYVHLCQILALFTMPNHQILSCNVTQARNFENF